MAAQREYGLALTPLERLRDLDAVVLAVPHRAYLDLGEAGARRHADRQPAS